MPVHIFPREDWIDHRTDGEPCPCEPREEYINPETGLPFENGPVVIHERLSGPNNEPIPGLWAVLTDG